MEWAEGGVWGWGGKDWGTKCSSRKPAPRLNPIGTPPRHPVPRPKTPPTPNKKEPAGSARSNDQECSPTKEKRADQPAHHNHKMPHKGGHMINMPNHPRTRRAEPTEHPVPDVWGTVKTTNPKRTPPTRNHPADKQTPPQYKVEKSDATTKPSDARPAAPTLRGQSCRAQGHCPNTTAHHTVEDRTQERAPKAKAVHKAHAVQMRPH
ncbi:hypothetical protein CRENBAI_009321 [Crenichthys baileyi]|uniref:Uncharacterized protein n=1 Tax=Crenichthys baileyi TaxID=28760 RepID=A0AAV9SEC6_9TELE